MSNEAPTFDVPRAALQCASEGNVPPATPLDRHTGRVALATPNARLSYVENEEPSSEDVGSLHPAGSRDSSWRPPPGGSGAGGAIELTAAGASSASKADSEDDAVFPRYLSTKCPTHRGEWLKEVERETEAFRKQRAMQHRGKARYAHLVQDASRAKWHEIRANGQLVRFDRVEDCGQTEVLVRCEACNTELRRRSARCGHRRLCEGCRAEYALRQQCRFRPARLAALARTSHLRRHSAPGGRWGERFLTLTVPHSRDVERDILTLPRAWQVFRKLVWQHLREDRGLRSEDARGLAFVRVIEATAGRDLSGHAHIHVWLLSPFLHHALLRHLWGRALRKFGYALPQRALIDVLADVSDREARDLQRWLVPRRGARTLGLVDWPVIDIRRAVNVERELIKYLVKDAEWKDGALERVGATLFGGMYRGLERVRTIVTSRNFWTDDKSSCACPECGGTTMSRRIVAPAGASRESHE